jgi:proteasome accessory factor C
VSAAFTAQDRLARLLAVIPWVAGRPDGATVAEIEQRFDYPKRQLLKDLQEVVFYVGVPPYTPGDLIEVDVTDDRVHIAYADWFARPMRLSPEERLRLVTAATAVLAFDPEYGDDGQDGGDDGADDEPDGEDGAPERRDAAPPLARALAKLAAAGDAALEVHLGDVPALVRSAIEQALSEHRALELDYYAYGRDERTVRVVEPHRLFSDVGEWYLAAHCRRAGAPRVFRVDRIRRATVLDDPIAPVEILGGDATFRAPADAPRIDLALSPKARWVVEQYPHEGVAEADDGWIRVRLAVSSRPWLERLLLRLGEDARVEAGSADGARAGTDVVAGAAARILARYHGA